MRLVEEGTIPGCTHPNARAVDSTSGYPADTSIVRTRCFDCGAAWTEEFTPAEMDALQRETELEMERLVRAEGPNTVAGVYFSNADEASKHRYWRAEKIVRERTRQVTA